jgi:hypothetical protein
MSEPPRNFGCPWG